jgi:signal transduction histidine kinase
VTAEGARDDGAPAHADGALVDDLLDVSRITTGKLSLRREPTELAAVMRSAVDTVMPYVEARRHALNVVLPRVTVHLDADPTRLAQVFSNLLHNAAKFTPPGGRIALSCRRAAARWPCA